MTAPRSPRGPRPAETTILVVDDDPVILTLVDVPEVQLLKKPFVAAQLVSSIREALPA